MEVDEEKEKGKPSSSAMTFHQRLSRIREKIFTNDDPSSRLYLEGLVDALAKSDNLDADEGVRREREEYAGLMVNAADFEEVAVLGRGHFGVVKLVSERANPGRCYAMKVMETGAVTAERAMVERNALAAARCDWVTKLKFAFQESGRLHLVMEYCPGGDLRSLLDRQPEGRFSTERTRFYLAELTLAINAIHKMGFVHRDIKPENILIDRFGHIKITDFGSADYLRQPEHGRVSALKSERRPVGTPNYVSPEVLQCLDADSGGGADYDACKSDFWSMGVVGYEMATGCTPFADENSMINTYSNIMSNNRAAGTDAGRRRLNPDLRSLLDGLLTDVEKRMGFDELVRHEFFLNIDWDELVHTCAPFVPDIKDLKDTCYFDTERSFDETGARRSPMKTPRGKRARDRDQVVIGFSYAGKHGERMRYSRQFGGDDCSDIVSSLRRQNEDLRLKLARLEQEVKTSGGSGAKRRRRDEDDQDDQVKKYCEKEAKDLRKTIERLEKVLETERAESSAKEKQSLEMLTDLKKKWQDREEARIEKIRTALEKSEKKRSQAEQDLLKMNKMLEDKQSEMDSVLTVKTSLKNKLKEYRARLQSATEQCEEERKKSALLACEKEDSSLELERETENLRQSYEMRLERKEEELVAAKRESGKLEAKVDAMAETIEEQRRKIKTLKEEKHVADKEHHAQLKKVKSSRQEVEASSSKLESEVRRLERENESARQKLSDKNAKLAELESVLKKLEDKIRPIDRLSRSLAASPRKETATESGECAQKDCKEARDDLKMQKIEVRMLERKTGEMESRIKFLRETMLKEERAAKEKALKEAEEAKEQLAKSEGEIDALKSAKEAAETKLARLESDTQALRKKASDLRVKEDECRSAKHELEAAQRKLKSLKEEAAEQGKLRSNCNALKAACLELEDQNAEYETVVEKLSSASERLKTEADSMRTQCRELSTTVSNLKVEKNELKSKLIQAESRLKEVSAKHDEVEAMYRKEERDWSEKITRVSRAKESQEASLDSLKEQLTALSRNYERAAEDSSASREENRQLKEETAELKTNVVSLKESNLKLHSVIEETLEKIGRRNREIQKLEETLQAVQSDKERKESEANVQINQLRKLVDHLKSKNDALLIGPKASKTPKKVDSKFLPMTYEELLRELDQERHKTRMLAEEIRLLQSPMKAPLKTSNVSPRRKSPLKSSNK